MEELIASLTRSLEELSNSDRESTIYIKYEGKYHIIVGSEKQ